MYVNNTSSQFDVQIRQYLILICKKKENSDRLRQKMTAEKCSKEAIKKTIKRADTDPYTQVKNTVAKKQIPDGNYLDANAKPLLQDFLSVCPEDYAFERHYLL
jgi:hypothetical protein